MSEIKWIKITTNMFEDEKIKLIDALPERDTIHYIWLRLLVQAGKTNSGGLIYLSENVPYTEEMLSTIFARPLNSIRLAIETLKNFGMIQVFEDKIIKIRNWDKHQNVEGMERVREQGRLRAQRKRERDKKLLQGKSTNDKESNVTNCESNVTVTEQKERENKKESKNKIENKEREKDRDRDVVLTEQANKIIQDYEKIGFSNIFNVAVIKVAIVQNSEEYVRMAIDKALLQNKPNMTYVNGILRNWRKEGYPKEVKDNAKSDKFMSSTSNEFKGFKPQAPRTINEAERKKAECQLI